MFTLFKIKLFTTYFNVKWIRDFIVRLWLRIVFLDIKWWLENKPRRNRSSWMCDVASSKIQRLKKKQGCQVFPITGFTFVWTSQTMHETTPHFCFLFKIKGVQEHINTYQETIYIKNGKLKKKYIYKYKTFHLFFGF